MADVVDALRKLALSLPDVKETIACAGTVIEQASFRTRGKGFLFVQRKGDVAVVRMKLDESLDQVKEGAGIELGRGGWVTCRLPLGKAPAAAVKRWVGESHALFVGATGSSTKKKAAELLATDMAPDDFAKAIAADVVAAAAWKRLPPSHKREHIKAIVEAKRPETRVRRIGKAIAMLAAGPARKGAQRG